MTVHSDSDGSVSNDNDDSDDDDNNDDDNNTDDDNNNNDDAIERIHRNSNNDSNSYDKENNINNYEGRYVLEPRKGFPYSRTLLILGISRTASTLLSSANRLYARSNTSRFWNVPAPHIAEGTFFKKL